MIKDSAFPGNNGKSVMRSLCICALLAATVAVSGCGPVVKEINQEGLREHYAGNYIDAIGLFKAALEKDRARPSTLYYIGRSYTALAEKRFRDGDARMARRNLDDAVFYFDRALGLFPNYEEAIREKNKALELQGEYDKALKEVKANVGLLGPSANTKILLAKEYEQRGDYDNALNHYRQAIAIEPLNGVAHAELGKFYLRINRKDDAASSLSRAYRLKPDLPGVVAQLKALGAWPPE